MRARVAWAVVLYASGLAACAKEHTDTPAGPLPPDSNVAAEFRTDKTQYTIGGSAKTVMVNRSTSTFTMGYCNDVLERQSGTDWVEIPPGNVACIALALIIAPGDSATLPLDLRLAASTGVYRVRRLFSVSTGNSSQQAYVRTNTFVMVR